MGRIRFSKLIEGDIQQFGEKASHVITKAGKESWKTAVNINDYFVYTGSLRANWKLSTQMSYYEPVRYGSKENPRAKPRVPKFKFRYTLDRQVHIFNNMAYADKVEYGLGEGSRSPALMIPAAKATFVKVAQSEFKRIQIR